MMKIGKVSGEMINAVGPGGVQRMYRLFQVI